MRRKNPHSLWTKGREVMTSVTQDGTLSGSLQFFEAATLGFTGAAWIQDVAVGFLTKDQKDDSWEGL